MTDENTKGAALESTWIRAHAAGKTCASCRASRNGQRFRPERLTHTPGEENRARSVVHHSPSRVTGLSVRSHVEGDTNISAIHTACNGEDSSSVERFQTKRHTPAKTNTPPPTPWTQNSARSQPKTLEKRFDFRIKNSRGRSTPAASKLHASRQLAVSEHRRVHSPAL